MLPTYLRNPARHEPVDHDAMVELILFADDTGKLYPQKKSIIANLKRMITKGTYDPAKAPKAWMHWLEPAAKRYAKEFADPRDWNQIFTKATREAAAAEIAVREEALIRQGEYD